MNLSHFQIIDSVWTPSKLNREIIEKELKNKLNRVLNKDIWSLDVRGPEYNLRLAVTKDTIATNWHQDSTGEWDGYSIYLCLWSNKNSTLLYDMILHEVIQTGNGSLVIFDNQRFKHKLNLYGDNRDRWFARYMIEK